MDLSKGDEEFVTNVWNLASTKFFKNLSCTLTRENNPTTPSHRQKLAEYYSKEINGLALSSRCVKDSVEAMELFTEANQFYSKDDFHKSVEVYTRCLALCPLEDDLVRSIYLMRALSFQKMGCFALAAKDAEQCKVHGGPNCPDCKEQYLILLLINVLAEFESMQFLEKVGEAELKEQKLELANTIRIMYDELCSLPNCSDLLMVKRSEVLEDLKDMYYEMKQFPATSCPVIQDFDEFEFCPHRLSGGHSKRLPSASQAVTVKYNLEYGRHLVANRDIRLGDILILEEPYAFTVDEQHLTTHCSYCLKRCHNLQACPACFVVLFCREECREKAMLSFHSLECPIMVALATIDIVYGDPLALRIICTAGIEELKKHSQLSYQTPTFVPNKRNPFISSDFASVHSLSTRLREGIQAFKDNIVLGFWLRCMKTAGMEDAVKLGGEMLHIIQLVNSNAQPIDEYCSEAPKEPHSRFARRTLGKGLYPTASLINHSCVPNAFQYFWRSTMIVRALHHIKAGEQIFINYGVCSYKSEPKRRMKILDDMGIPCKCFLCTEKENFESCCSVFKLNGLDIDEKREICLALCHLLQSCKVDRLTKVVITDKNLENLQLLAVILAKYAPKCKEFYFVMELVKFDFIRSGNLFFC